MKKLSNKEFYMQIVRLVIPMALQNLINVGVTATDVFMLGEVSETVLAGSSMAGQIQFIMTFFLFGITSGATVLTAQYWGKKDIRTIEKIMGIAMVTAVGTSIMFAVAAGFFPEQLLGIYTNEAEVIKEGAKYLRVVACSYIFSAMTQVYLYVMRSMKKVVIATVVYTVSFVANIIGNELFIFGLFGLPKMGITGAALSTLICRIIELLIVIWYARTKGKEVKFHVSDMWNIDEKLFKDFLTYAIPVIMNEALWGIGSSANSAILGHLGSAAIAANSVAQVTRQLAFVGALGVSSAAGTYIGNTIGEKKYELAKEYGNRFVKLSFVIGVAGGAMIILFSFFIKNVVTLTPDAQKYLSFMFCVMAYFIVCQSMNTTMIVGIMRAGGDIKYGLALDVGCVWTCSVFCGAIASLILKVSVPVAYVILMSDEVIKLPLAYRRYRSLKWVQNLTRE